MQDNYEKTKPPSVLKAGATKALLKEYSQCEQVDGKAPVLLNTLIVQLLQKVAVAAGIEAKKKGLTRLMSDNVATGFAKSMGKTGVAPDPEKFLQALHKMELKELGELLRLITEWTNDDSADVGDLRR